MKKILSLLFFLFLSYSITAHSQESIKFIDMKKLIYTSKAGASINKALENISKSNIKKFKKVEKNLKEREEKIIAQKNTLKKDEFNDKINKLKLDATNYRKTVKNANDDLKKKRIKGTNDLLKTLNVLIADYSKKNSISIILQKEFIVMGKKELDITDEIILLVDLEVTKININ